ncbi:MAG: LPXTG cell wall anchor domain-containing protein [Lachnospiraceae bacterium]|nr:LPXTG cell wall anchor domain-containing protein [Lachnospiraceae bacterium]
MKIRWIAALTAAAAVMIIPALSGHAAFREQPIEIPFHVAVKADGSGESCRIVIECADDPEQDRILTVKEGSQMALSFRMEEPGSRTYRIYQLEGTRSGMEYDKSVYTAVVFAWNDGGGLQGTVILNRDAEAEKPAEAVFCNRLNTTPEQPPEPQVKTGDETRTVLWSGAGLAAAAAAGVLFLLFRRGKRL